MKKRNNRFKSEVHLGILVIIFILLLLNVTSNFIIYKARSSQRELLNTSMNKDALSLGRMVVQETISNLSKIQSEEFKQTYKLSSIILISSEPEDWKPETKKKWFKSIVNNLPPKQVPEIALKLLSANFKKLTRGENNEYFYVYPVPTAHGRKLLILSKNNSDLALLDDASKVILIINIISIIVIALVYISLYRFILSPFRKIKKQAIDAGRVVPPGEDDVDAMVDEYQKIIDELKEKENELIILNEAIQRKADSLEQFNNYLMKSMSSGIITVDKQGEILSVNDAAEQILQIDSNNFTRKHYKNLFNINVSIIESINSTLQSNKNHPYREYVIKVNDSLILNLGVIISVIHDNINNPIGASILINDLTEIKKLRRDLETKTRLVALGEMAGGLAHQLRNSIGAVLGYSRLLKKRLLKNNLETGSLDALEAETKEAEVLIDRFLQFARPSNFYPQKTNINSLIKEVIEKFKIREDFQLCDFVLNEKNFENIEAEFDSLLIKQALANIIENGVNAYCGQESAVEINLSTSKETVIIEIKDFGCGIKEENLDKIFTPFFSSRPSGTGLGLSLAKKIIDLHQGRLEVFSELEQGTSFTIYLPIKQNKKDKIKLEEMSSF